MLLQEATSEQTFPVDGRPVRISPPPGDCFPGWPRETQQIRCTMLRVRPAHPLPSVVCLLLDIIDSFSSIHAASQSLRAHLRQGNEDSRHSITW